MSRTLSLLVRLPSFEDDGIIHRRDCGCARCDAGFGPTELERAEARRRWEEKQGQEAALRVAARKKENDRLKRAEAELFVSDQVKAADDHLRALRELERRVRGDRRLDELWRLRSRGLSLSESMAEVDQRFPSPGGE